jgi:hypothetical protein
LTPLPAFAHDFNVGDLFVTIDRVSKTVNKEVAGFTVVYNGGSASRPEKVGSQEYMSAGSLFRRFQAAGPANSNSSKTADSETQCGHRPRVDTYCDEVRAVKDKRLVNGILQYKVSWVHEDEGDSTLILGSMSRV